MSIFRRFRARWAAALLSAIVAGTAVAQSPNFPRPAEIEPDIAFWKRVYTEIDTSSGFIHDSKNLGVVYRTVRFDEDVSRRQRNGELRQAYAELREILERLGSGRRQGLSAEERRVLSLWPDGVSNAELKAAADRLRFQLGQADRFRAGLIRSGTWRPFIENALAERGLPRELAALPHVESSFDPTAYSKVGAAGMWQFTRSTGLRYMQIDHIVDERRDPFLSTLAAAQLLENNFDILQSWPLAVTAYNHGVGGMRQAKSQQGTDRIEVILRNYTGRTFGFASRNFYVAFLAAVEVDADAERYFGPLKPNPPAESGTLNVPDFVTVSTLEATLEIDGRQLRYWNPALMEPVWSGDKFVPQGFELRLPASVVQNAELRLAAVPAAQRYAAQMPDIFHRVGRGDTISEIAARYGVSMSSLVALNGLQSRNFIRAGQVLRLPGNDGTVPMTLAQVQIQGSGDATTYVVRSGDSINRIARLFGLDEAAILALNGIRDPNRIYVGQELRVAGPADAAQAPAAVLVVAMLEEETPAFVEADLVSGAPPPELAPLEQILAEPTPAVGGSQREQQRLLAAEAALGLIMDTRSLDDDAGVVDAADAPELAIGTDDSELERLSPDANVLASEQADLAADPSNYFVAADGTIEVQALETLGHYADWLGIRTQRLRDINGLPFGQGVVIGRRLKLDFSTIDAATFEQRRADYQQQNQEAFFLRYQVTDTLEHVVARGESLWVLASRRYNVPVWLLRQYNPDLDLDQVRPGTVVKFPELRPITAVEAETRASN
ncbi:MAG TPA: LysM peptidoglycan-binding domain-containing protein [Gammaproteobacteria bacterium]|jgi:membrane-bound lytic murein transglycosylase D